MRLVLNNTEGGNMQKIAVLLALAFGILFPALSQAYVVAPKVGVVMVEIKRGDTFSGVCSDLSKKGLLPEKFGAVRCKNSALARNGLTEESARYIQPGDLYFFPYLPLAKYEGKVRQEIAASLLPLLNKAERGTKVVGQRLKAAEQERDKALDQLREWKIGAFLGMGMLTIFAVLIFFLTRGFFRVKINNLKSWQLGEKVTYTLPGTKKTVSFKVVGSGFKQDDGREVPFLRLQSSLAPDVVVDSYPANNVYRHMRKHLEPSIIEFEQRTVN